MEQICEEHVLDAKDCSELAIQIFEALRESASQTLQPIIQSLICFELSRRIPYCDGVRQLVQPPTCLTHLPVTEFSNLTDALDDFS
jgi:hypothetical protein